MKKKTKQYKLKDGYEYTTYKLSNGATATILPSGKLVAYTLGNFRWFCHEYRLTN